MEVTREQMIAARDRALRAVSLAVSVEKAQAAWVVAKNHNRFAREIEAGMALEMGGAGAVGRETTGQPLTTPRGGARKRRELVESW